MVAPTAALTVPSVPPASVPNTTLGVVEAEAVQVPDPVPDLPFLSSYDVDSLLSGTDWVSLTSNFFSRL